MFAAKPQQVAHLAVTCARIGEECGLWPSVGSCCCYPCCMLHLQREYCGMSVADCCKTECAQHCNVGGVDTVGVLSSKLAVAAMLSVQLTRGRSTKPHRLVWSHTVYTASAVYT